MTRRCTLSEVIKAFQEVHGNKYDYSEVEYVNTHTKVKIYCNTCKEFFWQKPGAHKRGIGCKKCGIRKCSRGRLFSNERVIKDFQKIHGIEKYSYKDVEYKGSEVKVKIFCNTCEKYFYQYPKEHKRGQNCPDCAIRIAHDKRRLNKKEVIERFKDTHNKKYDYSKVNYVDTNTPVKIYCNSCREYFYQRPSDHFNGHGCAKCGYVNTYSPTQYGLRFGNAQVYVLKMYSNIESFYKIGITSQGVKERYRKECDYKYKVLGVFNMTGYGARRAEIAILQYYKDFQYSPEKYFAGHTECFSEVNMGKINEICSLYKNEKVNLIGRESKQFEEFLEMVA